MRKKKGAALPTAVILCMFMLVVTFGVTYLVIENFTVNRISEYENTAELIFLTSHNQYVKNNGDKTKITDTTYDYEDYQKEGTDIKALVAYSKNGDMEFYSIYDFNENKLLAYQTSNFYITESGLGGIVPIEEN